MFFVLALLEFLLTSLKCLLSAIGPQSLSFALSGLVVEQVGFDIGQPRLLALATCSRYLWQIRLDQESHGNPAGAAEGGVCGTCV